MQVWHLIDRIGDKAPVDVPDPVEILVPTHSSRLQRRSRLLIEGNSRLHQRAIWIETRFFLLTPD